MLNNPRDYLRAMDAAYHAADADPDDTTPPYLPWPIKALMLAASLSVLYSGGCAAGWW